jgi:uncharacterized protein
MLDLERAKSWYRKDDPVHGYDHVQRVFRLAEYLGQQLKADLEIIRAAVLLHDASGAEPDGTTARMEHALSSADFAAQVLREEGWGEDRIQAVMHCIRAHRFRSQESPATLEARIVFDADKLDVMGAFGAARTIGYALQAGEPIYAEPSRTFVEHGELSPGERHSAYHEYLFKLRRVRERLQTEPAKQLADQRHRVLTTFFDQLARESRFGEEGEARTN